MYTIGALAKRYGLSRSTLLYYDRIGLLRPGTRSGANYRLYTETDIARLEKIRLYRQAGVALAEIGCILDGTALNDEAAAVLERRLAGINGEIARARKQQKLILRLLGGRRVDGTPRVLDKKGWTGLLKATGLSEQDMIRWHVEFEKLAPEAHQDFLEALGMEAGEITLLRRASAEDAAAPAST